MINNEDFSFALQRVRETEYAQGGIGRLGEKTLHAALKYYLEPDESRHEVRLGRYVADIVNGDGVTEIQTRSFNALRSKLAAFLEYAPVTVVYPIARTKWLVWIDPENWAATKKRKSPKTGTFYDVFFELYKIKPFLKNENFRLKLLLIDLVEYRNLNGWSSDRKKGSSRYERIPEALAGELELSSSGDYRSLVPGTLAAEFTSADFSKAAKISRSSAQTALHILHEIGVVVRVGRNGRGYRYQRNGFGSA